MSVPDLRTLKVDGGYRTILADPPWRFNARNMNRKVASRRFDPYPTMSFEELAAVPVAEIAAPDSALFMWAIASHLDQAIDLGRAWGFTYKTMAWWDKGRMSFGYWWRSEGEPLLLFTRGQISRSPGAGGVRQTIRAPKREHSRKPDEQYDQIETLVADGRRIELFSRQNRPGWTSWGLETGTFR